MHYNLADYGIVGDGNANDRLAVLDFKDAAQGDSNAILTIPDNVTLLMGAQRSPPGADNADDYLFDGILGLTVNAGTNVVFTDGGGGGDFHFGSNGTQYQDNAHSARLYTANAGDQSVRLKDISKASLFHAGDVALIAGYDMQGWYQFAQGFPANPFYFQWVDIQSVSGDLITFTTLLRETYLDTWPELNSGSSGEVDNGGPATLYAIKQNWNATHVYNNFTIDKTGSFRKGTNGSVRFVTYDGVTATNRDIVNASTAETFTVRNCDFTGASNNSIWEVDKLMTDLVVEDSNFTDIQVQSSAENLTMSGCTTEVITGTLRRNTFTDCTFNSSVDFCPDVHGRTDSATFTNCVFNGGIGDPGGNIYLGPGNGGVNAISSGFSMSAGKITIPNTAIVPGAGGEASQLRWCVPDTWCMWFDQDRRCINMFQVLSVTQDDTNVYIQTSESGSWPSYNSLNGGKLGIRVHPCPDATFTNCTGTATALSLSQATAHSPLWSYSKYTYDGKAGTSGEGSSLWGNLTSLDMNVTVQTSGAKLFNPLGDFCWLTLSDGSLSPYPGYAPDINFNITGDRLITTEGNVQNNHSSIKSLDNHYTLPEVPAWFANKVFGQPVGGNLTTGTQSITVTVETDQGITAAEAPSGNAAYITSPVHLRLRFF